MDQLQQILQNLFGPKKLISPLATNENPGGINDSTQAGLNYYYQTNYAGQQSGVDPNASVNKTVQYPQWMANNQKPQQQVLGANTQQPQNAIGEALNILNPKPQKAYAEEYPEGSTDYEKKAAGVFNKYGVPPEVGLGIWAMEGRGKTINPNNPYNIGAYDSNPQNANAYNFKNPLEGTEEAAKFLAGQSDFQDSRVKQIFQKALAYYKKTNDSTGYLKQIAPVYSSNPKYAQIIQQTPEYQRWGYNTKN